MNLRVTSLKVLSQTMGRLLRFLEELKPRAFNATLMPDFFLDRFVSWNGTANSFSKKILEVASRKGGNIDRIPQVELQGGNAINTAKALSALDVETFPIVCTSRLGLKILELHLQSSQVDLSHVKIEDKASITTALEFNFLEETRNVMLRDLGSLEDFSSSLLEDRDYSLLETTDYICIFNWGGMRKHGTALVESIFQFVKDKGEGKTYFDTADPLPNETRIPELIKRVLLKPDLVEILSLNENEAITYAGHIAPRKIPRLKKQHMSMPILAARCAEILSQKLTSRIDLHTTAFSGTYTKDGSTQVPAFPAEPLRATGAGDAWNAANIFADANKFATDLRLAFANAFAACYVSSPAGKHPRLPQLRSFIHENADMHGIEPL